MTDLEQQIKDQAKVIKALLAERKKLKEENEQLREKVRSFYGH